ncbi:MAG: lysozyme [Lachnotalea sp.]
MKISDEGIELIKGFEGVALFTYRCRAGVLTIGYGHTSGVTENQVITQDQAESYLKTDLAKFEANVNKYDGKYTWNQNEFDALVSFAYNLGSIDALTANGTRSRSVIADKMLLYNKVGKTEVPGLTTRRKAERALFLKDCKTSTISISETSSSAVKESENYIVGTYKLTANLKVRMGAGTNYKAKSYSQLTKDGKAHATSAGVLKSGTRVTVSKIIKNGSDTWGITPSGYIALHYNNKSYASKC